jgi:hypothetical protein
MPAPYRLPTTPLLTLTFLLMFTFLLMLTLLLMFTFLFTLTLLLTWRAASAGTEPTSIAASAAPIESFLSMALLPDF